MLAASHRIAQARAVVTNAAPYEPRHVVGLFKEKVEEIDYKNYNQLRRYMSEKGKIRSRRISGACRRHQRQVAVAIKRAREMALLPYAVN